MNNLKGTAEMAKYTFHILSTLAGSVYLGNQSWKTERGAQAAGTRYMAAHKFPYADCIVTIEEVL